MYIKKLAHVRAFLYYKDMEEFKKFTPEIYNNLKELDFSKETKIKYGVYENMPSISIEPVVTS